MILIASVDADWGLGKDGALLARVSEDLKNFKRLTMGKAVVMGRVTLATLPNGQPLAGRDNIILTRDPTFRCENAQVVHDLPQLLQATAAYPADNVCVIGGGSVYRLLLPYCSHAYLTRFHARLGADCFLPRLDQSPAWRLCEQSETLTAAAGFPYTFETYERICDNE